MTKRGGLSTATLATLPHLSQIGAGWCFAWDVAESLERRHSNSFDELIESTRQHSQCQLHWNPWAKTWPPTDGSGT